MGLAIATPALAACPACSSDAPAAYCMAACKAPAEVPATIASNAMSYIFVPCIFIALVAILRILGLTVSLVANLYRKRSWELGLENTFNTSDAFLPTFSARPVAIFPTVTPAVPASSVALSPNAHALAPTAFAKTMVLDPAIFSGILNTEFARPEACAIFLVTGAATAAVPFNPFLKVLVYALLKTPKPPNQLEGSVKSLSALMSSTYLPPAPSSISFLLMSWK